MENLNIYANTKSAVLEHYLHLHYMQEVYFCSFDLEAFLAID